MKHPRSVMSTRVRWLVAGLIIAMVVLHQDVWFWTDRRLVFGFVPVGLAYHAAYSVLAAFVMAILVKVAWPRHLEPVEPPPQQSRKRKRS